MTRHPNPNGRINPPETRGPDEPELTLEQWRRVKSVRWCMGLDTTEVDEIIDGMTNEED
jgi:hypothetical protein